ncbi:MAG: ABC transporter permease [bacterium]
METTSIKIILGSILVSVLFFLALFAGQLAPYNPLAVDISEGLHTPSAAHWFGQDKLGRDILSRVIYGSRISLSVGLVTVAVSLLIGSLLGAVSGWFGGIIDHLIMRLVDILMAFPGILLAIGIMAVLGPSLQNVVLALCFQGWVGYARLVRGEVLAIKEEDFILAAKAQGAGANRIIFRHIFPNIMAPLIVQGTFGIAGAILAEAGLSFLGLGVQPPAPSWGAMLSEGCKYLLVAPHLSIFPGIAIMMIVLGVNFLGDGLHDSQLTRSIHKLG